MQTADTIKGVKELTRHWKKSGRTVGFVPTMGFLHEGHLSLIKASIKENDHTVVSIFVNPIQFANSEDFASYPKDFGADEALCKSAGVDLIFYPAADEIYPPGFSTYVRMEGLTAELCGKSRPTHFQGVCTVVSKLLNIVAPDKAYFGQKDAQQLAVISRMALDLDMDTQIIGCPTIREADGLAKSSRNAYLSSKERQAAVVISKAVFGGERMVAQGERNAAAVLTTMRAIIESEPLAKIDYIEAVDAVTIEKIETLCGRVLVAVAVFVGETRLIDNFIASCEG
ncbi:MAG: pantoate--beta-alanine ligase [Oscillospiraceae bacterium]|nr:pantoate--beta-alanine ligase [Oscillospiraceae bacterium]